MSWLERKIEIHNSKITYADYEESWTKPDWILSIIFQALLGIGTIVLGAYRSSNSLIILGCIYIIIDIIWHFWHLLYW